MAEDDESVRVKIASIIDDLNREERRRAVLTAPSDEPLSWPDRSTRLVRLDVAVFALHLFAVRVGVKSIPGVIRQRLAKTLKMVGEFVGEWVAVRVFGAVVSKVVGPIQKVRDLWQAESAQRELEEAVRRAGIRSQRELYLFKLSQRSRVRRRERVLTRHPIPRQRRPNGSTVRH